MANIVMGIAMPSEALAEKTRRVIRISVVVRSRVQGPTLLIEWA